MEEMSILSHHHLAKEILWGQRWDRLIRCGQEISFLLSFPQRINKRIVSPAATFPSCLTILVSSNRMWEVDQYSLIPISFISPPTFICKRWGTNILSPTVYDTNSWWKVVEPYAVQLNHLSSHRLLVSYLPTTIDQELQKDRSMVWMWEGFSPSLHKIESRHDSI